MDDKDNIENIPNNIILSSHIIFHYKDLRSGLTSVLTNGLNF
jgi:hypothetical protein